MQTQSNAFNFMASHEELLSLDDVIANTAVERRPPQTLIVGECVDDRHPSLAGRVRVRWDSQGETRELWMPCLQGLAVRPGDRVLVQQPANWSEPIVIGVLDGYAKRPETEHRAAPTLELKTDETVRIADADGRPMVEVYQGDTGPVVRLLQEKVELAAPGEMKLSAAKLSLEAKAGGVNVFATDDVVVRGEVIHLN